MAEATATPTETPVSPEPEPTASSAATPVESAPVEAAPAPETTEDGGGTEVEPTPEALLTNLAEHVQEREKVRHAEGRKEGASEAQARMQPFLQRREAAMKTVNQGIQDFASDFSEWRDDPTTDVKALDRLITKHKGTFDVLGQVHLEQGGWQGWNGFLNNLGIQSKNPALAQEFLPRIQNMASGDSDDGFWPDLVERLTDEARKEGKEEGRKLGNKETETRLAAEARANGRKGEAPPPMVAGSAGGGGKTDREKLLDSDTPVSELMEIRARQRAG